MTRSRHRSQDPRAEFAIQTEADPKDRRIESAEAVALLDIAKTLRHIDVILTSLVPTIRKATSVTLTTESEPA